MGIALPDGRTYHLRGGHRLWVAPEVPDITYEPDDKPVVVVTGESWIQVTQPASEPVGAEKSMTVRFNEAGRSVVVTHEIVNRGSVPQMWALWAITQLPVGGTALLPLNREASDAYSLQANASIVVWPYTGQTDTPFELNDRTILLDSNRFNPTKVGTALDRGWLAYVREGLVFVKRAQHVAGGNYVDRAASAQCYACADFVELETLGELTTLAPGTGATHTETWELHRLDRPVAAAEVPRHLSLDTGGLP